ncbi:hypothetical protein GIB67_020956 [Kingdonia uniflora]|uniref:Uncharacterized protein n=1 Tax=Kingdonia uniflora TaxID=39325 RepID=A0A7J7M7N2_9MAGN|nr:hypothetical protein GIB67_020956 [Kingdonia uniflora]
MKIIVNLGKGGRIKVAGGNKVRFWGIGGPLSQRLKISTVAFHLIIQLPFISSYGNELTRDSWSLGFHGNFNDWELGVATSLWNHRPKEGKRTGGSGWIVQKEHIGDAIPYDADPVLSPIVDFTDVFTTDKIFDTHDELLQ